MKREPVENNLPRLDDDMVRRVIGRALELDASSQGSVTPEELEAIAVDLGISRAAVRRALAELEQPMGRYRPQWIRRAKTLIAFSAIPSLLLLFPPPRVIFYATGATLDARLEFLIASLASSGVAYLSRGKLGHLTFQLANAGVWAATGALVAYPYFTQYVLQGSFVTWACSAILGSLLIELRNRGRLGTNAPPPSSAAEMKTDDAQAKSQEETLWSRLRRRFALFEALQKVGPAAVYARSA